VAIDASTIVGGAPNNSNPGSTPAAVYVFSKPAGPWATTAQATARLTPVDPLGADHFGGSVGISGSTIVAASRFTSFGGTPQQGAAYVFTKPETGWATASGATKISASGGGLQQAGSVAVDGSAIVEGAQLANVGTHTAQGAAYVFDDGTGTTPTTPTTPASTTPASATINFVSTPTRTIPDIGWGDVAAGLFGVIPGSGATVNWGQFVFIAACRRPAGGCAGTAVYTGASAGGASVAAARKAPVLGRASFKIASGKKGKVTVKLTKAAQKTLKKRHKLRGTLTVTVKRAGAADARLSHAYTVTLEPRKH